MSVVDLHCHITPQGFLERAPVDEGQPGLSIRHPGDDPVYRIVLRGTDVGAMAEHSYPVESVDYALDERLARMTATGVDVQVLSASPLLFRYGAEPADAIRNCRLLNDELAAIAHKEPGRFLALAMLPAQDADASVDELQRAVRELGMVGVMLGANVWGEDLDAPRLRPVLRAANDLGAVVFLHPAVTQSPPHAVANIDRIGDYYLRNLLGNPIDTTIAVARLIFSGVLEELPDLKVVLAHAGGYAPVAAGRLDHGYRVRPEAMEIPKPPSAYLRRVMVDTIAHQPEALRYLVEVMGPEQLVLGSDYPYDMGPADPVGDVRAAQLGSDVEDAVLGGNAARLLGLD